MRGGRLAAFGSLVAVAVVTLVIVLSETGRSGSATPPGPAAQSSTPARGNPAKPAGARVPILVYHVINQAPVQSALSQSMYVPAEQFAAQMRALKAAGWRAVTLNQLEANWTRGTALGSGKAVVISFDDGYASQYTSALPVLRQLDWVAVENLRVSGLPPAEGGLTDTQIRGLISAGWELDTDGVSQPDLTAVDPAQLSSEVGGARQTLQARYRVPVNWFCYPSGRYNPVVVAAARQAGYLGATTSASGWASPKADRFRLPRVQVVPGTSPSQLLSQITAASQTSTAPISSTGT